MKSSLKLSKELEKRGLSGSNNGRYSHGMSGTRPYSIWASMLTRCNNPKSKAYKSYGERSVKVCEKWFKFAGFWEDMKEGYSKDLTLDRINNNDGYYKENCKWSTREEQNNNKRTCRFFTMDGETLTLSQWARRLNIKEPTMFYRLQKGWSVVKALTTPVKIKTL